MAGEPAKKEDTSNLAERVAGKFLTFDLAEEEYGLEILRVREIIGMMAITPVPRTPDFVRGVINLRGKVIPVVCLRRLFGQPEAEATAQNCIIVLDIEHAGQRRLIGVVVDEVAEVASLDTSQIEPPPDLGGSASLSCVRGVGLLGKRVMMLLDAGDLLADQLGAGPLAGID